MSRKTKERKKKKNRDEQPEENKPVVLYGDITNRLMASMIDLAVIYLAVDLISQFLFNAFYPEGSEYVRIHTQIVTEYPHLATEPGKIFLFIMSKYPESMSMIFNQMGFNATIQIFLVGCYYIPMTKKYGATLGKMTLGLKVVDDITGKDITWSQSAVRYISYLISIGFFGLGLITGMISRKKRCWHDIIADTYVIYSGERWYKRYTDKVKAYFNLK